MPIVQPSVAVKLRSGAKPLAHDASEAGPAALKTQAEVATPPLVCALSSVVTLCSTPPLRAHREGGGDGGGGTDGEGSAGGGMLGGPGGQPSAVKTRVA